MPRKSFKDNPALRFISMPEADAAQEDTYDTDNAHNTNNTDNTNNAHDTQNTAYTHNTHSMYNTHNARTAPERKTKRLNLLIRPSLLRDVAKIAHMRRLSVNDLINTALDEYRSAHEKEIADYDRVFDA